MKDEMNSRRYTSIWFSFEWSRLQGIYPRSAKLDILLVLLCILGGSATTQTLVWKPEGPSPNTHGQVENIAEGEVTGAIKTVAPHPTDPNIVYVGTVNGGIWRTNNSTAAVPAWEHQSDNLPSLSIGALEFDSTDESHQTLVAGIGRFSSLSSKGGGRSGILRTTNGGTSWTVLDGRGALSGLNISDVAPRGQVIVLAANDADIPLNAGIWRTTDTGQTWIRISGQDGTGLPSGASSSLCSDPINRDRLFAAVAKSGVYRSNDTGATWTRVSDVPIETLLFQADNIKIAIGTHNDVYVAIDISGHVAGIFRSRDSGLTWVAMDLPTTQDDGIHAGGQGFIHLSIAADPSNGSVVYVGGDRQPSKFINGRESDPPVWPNSIGAMDYSGRLFRGDASKPSGSQWAHITHSNNLGAPTGGTAHGSAPHADSRSMRFTSDGTLIEVDDGGVYRRTMPQTSAGDWYSMNGNIQAAEFHSVAWDSISHLAVGGAQDTGTPEQPLLSASRWESISTGDGGVVAVDTSSAPGHSIRYSSYYSLNSFRRQVYDSNDALESEIFPSLMVLNGPHVLQPQFYTPIKLNSVVPTRLIIGAEDGVYESGDQGDTLTQIASLMVNGTGPNPIAYGANGNPDVLYIGSGSQVFVRTAANTILKPSFRSPWDPPSPSASLGGTVLGIAINPRDWKTAYVIAEHQVLQTNDAGDNWTDITGNLTKIANGSLRSITYSSSRAANGVVVGSDSGVFIASGPSFSTWTALGVGLPNAPVYHVEYNEEDHLLLAGTLGRGAWTLRLPTSPIGIRTRTEMPKTAAKAAYRPQSTHHAIDTSLQQRNIYTASLFQSQASNSFQLSKGTVVDLNRRRLYVMGTDNEIDAIDISTGKSVWTTKEAAKPIGISNDRVIAQAFNGETNELRIVALDAADGKTTVAGSIGLPAGVFASVSHTLTSDFSAIASPADGDIVISWHFETRPQGGVAPETKAALPGSQSIGPALVLPPDGLPPAASGRFRMNLRSGVISKSENAPQWFPDPTIYTEMQAFYSDAMGTQCRAGAKNCQDPGSRGILSADGNHILTSKRIGNVAEVTKYALTVYDQKTGLRLGEFRSPLAAVPFFVVDSRVIYETSPYIERTDKGLIEQPRKIRAADLTTGREIWSFVVRDIVYRGPFPP